MTSVYQDLGLEEQELSTGEDLTGLLQVPTSEWDLDLQLDLLGPPVLVPADARLQLVQSEDYFMDMLTKRFKEGSESVSSHEGTTPCDDKSDPLFALQQARGHQKQRTRAEQAAEVRAKNRAAQRKSRARKKEKEREVEDQVSSLSSALRSTERHKRFLQRSNRLLSAAAKEAAQCQPATGQFVPADGLGGMNPRAVMELREGFSEPLRLSPAQFVALQWDELQALWRSIAAAMLANLPAATKQPDSPAGAKLERLSREVSAIVTFAAFANPELCMQFLTKPTRQGDAGFWGPIAAALDVSDPQRDRLRALLGELTKQTQQLSAAEQHLQNAIKARGDGPEIGPDPSTGSNLAELLENVQADLCLVVYDFHAQCWAFTLTPLQVAVCTVAAPACPDLITIARYLVNGS